MKGHRYGLIGRNGVGKSTLLQRLASKSIPGMPLNARILLVKQQLDGSDTKSALQTLLDTDTERNALLNEQAELEARLGDIDDDENDVNENAADITAAGNDLAL